MAKPEEPKPDPRAAATRFLVGHVPKSSWEVLQEAADWCREHEAKGDVYGEGKVLSDFEQEVAGLLGMEAAVFMPSGTMAQQIAARIWCDRGACTALGMHGTSHLELHEQRGYAWLHGLRAVLVGTPYEAVTAAHLAACKERLGVLVVELPMREIGGVLPSWEQLQELKTAAKARGVPLHMDGARLWETAVHFGRPYGEITQGFDSAYVSFYKGIGGMTGSMLLGSQGFIDEAKVWQRRHGGNLYRMLPYIVTARLNFKNRLAQMPGLHAEALRVAAVLRQLPGVSLRPYPPQANMLHAILPRPAGAVKIARDRIATEDGVWLLGGTNEGETPGTTKTEMYFGDGAAQISDADVDRLFRKLLDLAGGG